MAEPRDNEYVALVREIQPVLEAAIKRNRGSEFTGRGNIVEGPLTWRQFHKKAVKAMQVSGLLKVVQFFWFVFRTTTPSSRS